MVSDIEDRMSTTELHEWAAFFKAKADLENEALEKARRSSQGRRRR
jgi:hypothetical protein